MIPTPSASRRTDKGENLDHVTDNSHRTIIEAPIAPKELNVERKSLVADGCHARDGWITHLVLDISIGNRPGHGGVETRAGFTSPSSRAYPPSGDAASLRQDESEQHEVAWVYQDQLAEDGMVPRNLLTTTSPIGSCR